MRELGLERGRAQGRKAAQDQPETEGKRPSVQTIGKPDRQGFCDRNVTGTSRYIFNVGLPLDKWRKPDIIIVEGRCDKRLAQFDVRDYSKAIETVTCRGGGFCFSQ